MQTAVDTAPAPTATAPPVTAIREPRVTHSDARPDFVVKLGGGRVALIEIKGGEATPRHLAKLERFIQLQKELLEDEDDEEDIEDLIG